MDFTTTLKTVGLDTCLCCVAQVMAARLAQIFRGWEGGQAMLVHEAAQRVCCGLRVPPVAPRAALGAKALPIRHRVEAACQREMLLRL